MKPEAAPVPAPGHVDPAVSMRFVEHPLAKAVAFTGSEKAGRAIFDAASRRPEPIPAFVEMGSTNPVFVLPGALGNADSLAAGLFGSINLGVGQFCTCPGVIVGQKGSDFNALGEKLAALFDKGVPGTMLHAGILKSYETSVQKAADVSGVVSVISHETADPTHTEAKPALFRAVAQTWLDGDELAHEIFGPAAVFVECGSREELLRVAHRLSGNLTPTIHGTPDDLKEFRDLIAILETKVGRLLFNGYPTGVEVSSAMHHGGPYPATADAKFTSVGTAAILRFLRPICFQNFPQEVLPIDLRNENPQKIWRTVNGKLTNEALT